MLVKNDAEGLSHITDLQREKLVESQLLNKRRLELVRELFALQPSAPGSKVHGGAA